MKRTNTRNRFRNKMTSFVVMMIACLLLSASVFAAPAVKKTEYEGKGKVEVAFKSKVKYKDVKVTVTDEDGKSQKAKILDKDSNDIEFKIANYKAGEKYTYKITGIRKKSEKEYGSVSGTVKIPKAAGDIPMKEIEYDARDKDVTFDFDTYVEWKSPKVTIKKDGKNYVKKIKEKDRDDIEVSVKKLKKGTTYKYTISGIRKKGSGSYTTISGTFKP